MANALKSALTAALLRLLSPLAHMLLEAGIGVGEAYSLLKIAYVRAARDQGRERGGEHNRPNISRISIVTGLTRAEVGALLEASDGEQNFGDRGRQRAERVLAAWWNDPQFQAPGGGPAVLTERGGRRSFAALVRKYSSEPRVPPIRDELLRVKAMRRLPDGRLQAISSTYATVGWKPEVILAMGDAAYDLFGTYLHNMKSPHTPLYVARIQNVQIHPDAAPILKRDMMSNIEALRVMQVDALTDPSNNVTAGNTPRPAVRLSMTITVFEEATVIGPSNGRARVRGA